MKDDRCVIEVGVHPEPYWRDRTSGMVVCNRHRWQYEERPDLGPFDWEHATSRETPKGEK